MNNVIRNVLLGGLLCLSVPLSAQVPQDLIDKAKAAGMTDEQIRQEMNKTNGDSPERNRPYVRHRMLW